MSFGGQTRRGLLGLGVGSSNLSQSCSRWNQQSPPRAEMCKREDIRIDPRSQCRELKTPGSEALFCPLACQEVPSVSLSWPYSGKAKRSSRQDQGFRVPGRNCHSCWHLAGFCNRPGSSRSGHPRKSHAHARGFGWSCGGSWPRDRGGSA